MKQNIVISLVIGVIAVVSSVLLGGTNIVKETTREVPTGAISSPDIMSPYISFGGVANWAYRKDMNGDAASTTVCVIQAPPVASSSLVHFGYRALSGTSTAMELKVYKSASQWLATNQIGDDAPQAASSYLVSVATSTGLNSANSLFGPNDWLVVQSVVQAGGNGTSSPTGVCQAQFVQI